jgi:CheY-like chemotaxis protein
MTVLIVDDEQEYRLLVLNVLTAAGIKTVAAENGEDALEKLYASPIDLIISDLYMPVMDGINFHRKVRSTPGWEKLPFLFVSGFDDPYTRAAVKDPRCDGFLRKASPVQDLLEWIKYLTTPEDRRPRIVPGGIRSSTEMLTRSGGRTGTRIFTF